MRLIILGILATGLAGLTGLAALVTALDLVPAESLEHPEGISLRQESATSPGGAFFLGYASGRSHRGGGLSGGK